ncbi:MAG: hypothetical protein QOJ94_2318 [Sphingomonadales bacterium]|jgi:hypothetical protein|nr:hypothetical protein [Sphingomonadales bacterium]
MFERALLFNAPFRHFFCFDSFPPTLVAEMRRVVTSPLPWGIRIGSFYETRRLDLRAHLKEAPNRPRFVEDRFVDAMRRSISRIFGEPLYDCVQVLGHRMLPGQAIGVHNDNPGLGFENYRVIVQLTARHRKRDGGALNLHLSDEPSSAFQSIRPLYNMSVGFEAGHASYHSVDAVSGRPRDALLFNFWHVGNSPAAERAVYGALGDLWREEDRQHPDTGLLAAFIAEALLGRWGAPPGLAAHAALSALGTVRPADPDLRRGPESAWKGRAEPPVSSEASALTALAVWLARAPRRTFDRRLWRQHAELVAPARKHLPAPARDAADAILFAEGAPGGSIASAGP